MQKQYQDVMRDYMPIEQPIHISDLIKDAEKIIPLIFGNVEMLTEGRDNKIVFVIKTKFDTELSQKMDRLDAMFWERQSKQANTIFNFYLEIIE